MMFVGSCSRLLALLPAEQLVPLCWLGKPSCLLEQQASAVITANCSEGNAVQDVWSRSSGHRALAKNFWQTRTVDRESLHETPLGKQEVLSEVFRPCFPQKHSSVKPRKKATRQTSHWLGGAGGRLWVGVAVSWRARPSSRRSAQLCTVWLEGRAS